MAMLPVQAPEQEAVREIRPRLMGSSARGLAGRSDERLVSIAKDGDERPFEVLYERHSPAILRYCRSLLRSTQEAEDVKQEVFVLAISALRRGAEPDAFRPWLYRVAHNACMSHLRTRRPVLVADNGVLVGPVAAAEPVQHHREELRQLLDDIGTLPDVQRGALLLREMDGFSYEQVGEVLGLPHSTVRATIFRARRTLQGLAAARDADCDVIQSELSDLADRRGRRGRHITSHLTVCSNCRDFRDGLRRRPTVLGGIAPGGPLGPGGLLLALKCKLLGGGATASGGAGTAIATGAGGGAGAAKIAAVAMSSIALLAGAGVEADHVIDHSRREAAIAPRHAVGASAARAASAPSEPASVEPGATSITGSADGVRDGVGLTAGPASPGGPASRTRAHARVKHRAVAATPAAGAPGTARAIAPGSTAAPLAAGDPAGTTRGDSDDADREASGTAGRERDHRSSRDDDALGAEPKGSGSTGSGSGSGSTGSGHDDAVGDSAPRTESHESDSSDRSGTPERRDDAPLAPAPSRPEGANTPPSRPPAGDDATPGTSESSGTPTPAPDPAPPPDTPADPAPDPDAPVQPPSDSPTVSTNAAGAADAAGTPDAGAADPSAGSTLPAA
jgi:RNA polymerase sigma factor (sigma-70 family)